MNQPIEQQEGNMTAATSHPATAICLQCGTPFETPNPWRQQFCDDDCRTKRRIALKRARLDRRAAMPARVLMERARNARWCAEHRGCRKPQPWLAGAPPFERHLPGATMALSFEPPPVWPVVLRNARGLHGAITALLDTGHALRMPQFSLFPAGGGWATHQWTDHGVALAGRSYNAALYDRPTTITLGPAFRMRAPAVSRRGHQRVAIEALTPVLQQKRYNNDLRPIVRPTTETLLGTLAGEWLQRLGVEYLRERDHLRLEVIEVGTEPAHVSMGGKYGVVHGWSGRVIVDCNAPARWLLDTAARVGFGARTAFGFGRVRVTEAPR